jgi:hypothetical protein
MDKLDLRKQYKSLYNPSAKNVAVVDVPAFNFAMVDGYIEPGEAPGTSKLFQEAIQALYGISYTLKFMSKLRKDDPIDYTVMALEGLWWVEDKEFDITRPDRWSWTVMILQPDHISEAMYQEALAQLRKKKPGPGVEKLRFERFEEGFSIQILHIGPYLAEPATVEKMHAFSQANGYTRSGKHHEIYLSDPFRTDPAKLKTVLRQPVEKAPAVAASPAAG